MYAIAYAIAVLVAPIIFIAMRIHAAKIARREAAAAARDRIIASRRAKFARRWIEPGEIILPAAPRKRGRPRKVNTDAAETVPARRPGRPRKEKPEAAAPTTAAPAETGAALPVALPVGNNAFAGQVVAFTGKLPGMTRREAIQAVHDNGGRAFESMPASTTLLVVGSRPGTGKLDLADEWIGQVRKITPPVVAEAVAGLFFLATAFCLVPILAALFA